MASEMRADWVTVAEARRLILDGVGPLGEERLPLLGARGAVLAEEVRSPLDLPLWDNSAMDGFAVRGEDVRGATAARPRELRVIDDVPAGGFPSQPLEPGTAVRVMTGAPVPGGADGVIRVEHTDGGSGFGTPLARVGVRLDEDAGKNIRPKGEDVRAGQLVLRSGTLLGPAELGVAAAVGRAELRVVRRPTVALLTSGDELVDVEGFAEVLAGRSIVSSNTYSLAAQLAEAGAEVRLLGIAADSPESLRSHLLEAEGCDALVTSAGISVGEHDHLRGVLLEMGLRVGFWRVKMRPGSPFGFGHLDELGGMPWFGLPGNPVSSMVTFEVLTRPALLRMSGRTALFRPTLDVELQEAYPARPGLVHFPRVSLRREKAATLASLTGGQGSGILTSMAAADALAIVPEDSPGAAPGQTLKAILLHGAPMREEPGY